MALPHALGVNNRDEISARDFNYPGFPLLLSGFGNGLAW